MIEPLRPAIESDATDPAPAEPTPITATRQNGQTTNLPHIRTVSVPGTSRLGVLPDPPAIAGRIARVTEWNKVPQPKAVIDNVPLPLCWGLVAISAAILLIEIWNYIR